MDPIRTDTAKHYRHIRRILKSDNTPTPDTHHKQPFKWAIVAFVAIIFILLSIWLLTGCARAFEPSYTDIQYVNAVYLAEGGIHAQYPYGIRSIKCESLSSCRDICLTTVKHNRKRYARYGYKRYPRFTSYLASRYCPTTGSHLSRSEKRLNKYWVQNVLFYLQKGQS